MTRTLIPARTPAIASLAALALALTAGTAAADPLEDAISPQYHGADVAAAVVAATGAAAASAAVPAAAGAQYHNNVAGDNSEPVTEIAPTAPAEPAPAPAAPET